jgi:glycosyltransferase involved in cell wall biosynthesis
MFKILMLTCQFMPDVFGGAEKQCQRVSRELSARGHLVTVLTSTQSMRHAGRDIDNGVQVRRIFTPIAPDLLGRWLLFSMYWICAVTLWGWANRKHFDVIHCHQGKFGAFVGVTLGRILRKPVIVKIGNSESDMDLLCLKRKFMVGPPMTRYVLTRRPLFVAISNVIVRNLDAFGCRDVRHIPNGIAEELSPPAPQATSNAEAVSFFYHGRVEVIKRIDVLLEAFASVVQKMPDATLHVVGDGAALDSVKRMCTLLGLDSSVTFHGQVDDVIGRVAGFDVFVNASRAEGFSNSLLEALTLGKVLVSTPVSGASEAIIDGANGFVARDFAAQTLATAMLNACRLLDDDARSRAVVASRQLVSKRFAMPIVVDQYEDLYRRMTQAYGS